MNKDDDERLIPNGQYRDAMNIEVSTSEDSDVGTAQNILGNTEVGMNKTGFGSNLKCVASISDEKNDVLYYFLYSDNTDYILEYSNDGVETLVFVDKNKDTLKFQPDNIITGVNIIDNLLFWTDNINEPKKINIDTCKEGTTGTGTQTQLVINGQQQGDIKEEHITVIKKKPNKAPTVVFSETAIEEVLLFEDLNFYEKIIGDTVVDNAGNNPVLITDAPVSPYSVGDILFLSEVGLTGTLPQNHQVKVEVITVTTANVGYEYTMEILSTPPSTFNNVFGDNITRDFNSLRKNDYTPIFEKEFVRFALRYKYQDGEYSAFSPFTQPVFLAGSFGFHPTKDPYNLGMENRAINVRLQDLVPMDIPKDVVQIDILFKKERSTTVYSIDSIKPNDTPNYWFENSYNNSTILSTDYGFLSGGASDNTTNEHEQFSYDYTGAYEITTENIYAALPANQILRPYDNIPRKALAQEITGNRLVYGNYLQNYNISSKDEQSSINPDGIVTPSIEVVKENRSFADDIISFPNSLGKRSIKSFRTYYLGVVFGDKYGRETPVFTSKDASIYIPYDNDDTALVDTNSDKSLRLKARTKFLPNNNTPDWATYLKYYIKQTTGEYYNLVLDRVYKSKEDEAFWLSFPSSDRNKVQEGDYFTIKKQVDIEVSVPQQNKIKIIDIKNEAPNGIKNTFVSLGKINSADHISPSGTNQGLTTVFPDLLANGNGNGPKPGSKNFTVRKSIATQSGIPILTGEDAAFTPSDKIAVRFEIINNSIIQKSRRYLVSAYSVNPLAAANQSTYVITLEEAILEKDGFILDGNAINTAQEMTIEFFLVKERDAAEFAGRFFVKVLSNAITQNYLIGSISDQYIYEVKAVAKAWFLADLAGTYYSQPSNLANDFVGILGQGLLGANGTLSTSTPTTTLAGIAAATPVGNGITDTSEEWELQVQELDDGVNPVITNQRGWIIDRTHFRCLSPADANTPYNASVSGRMTFGKSFGFNGYQPPGFGQSISPNFTGGSGPNTQHINSFEGIVTPDQSPGSSAYSPGGARRLFSTRCRYFDSNNTPATVLGEELKYQANGLPWVNGPYTPDPSGNGGTYMHLSYVCPGVDLHDGDFSDLDQRIINGTFSPGISNTSNNPIARFFEFGLDRIYATDILAEEGCFINLSSGSLGSNYLSSSPSYGAHTGEWIRKNVTPNPLTNQPALQQEAAFDVGFGVGGPAAQAIENNLLSFQRFQFEGDDVNIYNILSCHKINAYNHTSWNPVPLHDPTETSEGGSTGAPFYGYDSAAYMTKSAADTQDGAHHYSVAGRLTKFLSLLRAYNGDGYSNTVGLADDLFVGGDPANGPNMSTNIGYAYEKLKQTVVNFGKANNRRVVYILQLDGDPVNGTINPEDTSPGNTIGLNSSFTNIRFVDDAEDLDENTIPTSPAVFETEAKEDVDLNIYFEASDVIPLNIEEDANSINGHIFAPVGCKVQTDGNSDNVLDIQNETYPEFDFYPRVVGWEGNVVEINNPGIRDWGEPNTIGDQLGTFLNKPIRFYRNDLSYTTAKIIGIEEITDNYITKIKVDTKVFNKYVGLSWYNCFSFGNGVESNRIRDDFNESFILNGVKASTVLEEQYAEDRRKYGLIYSGLYNSTSGVNNLNQFIQAEKITKDINPTFGSIQKLYSRTKDLVTLCEDKILQIFVDRDLLFNADGNTNLLASNRFLGTVQPFRGKFGISKNPESFAAESFRAYFTDKQRGAVLRLSLDGLTPISEAGMSDWFRDNLPQYNTLYGSYDSYNGDYNVSMFNNIVLDGGNNNDNGNINYDDDNDGVESTPDVIDENLTGYTVTYNEKSKGWVSFKSYMPENAVSSVKQYYTFKDGFIYKHHTNEDRNTFYNVFGESSITPVLNSNPELVKNFNAINYEGSQAKIDALGDTIINEPLLSNIGGYSGETYNDNEYYNIQQKKGWYVFDVRTNKQEGKINEFIEKEGKWFNYIKGKELHVDSGAFNFQGLGTIIEAEII